MGPDYSDTNNWGYKYRLFEQNGSRLFRIIGIINTGYSNTDNVNLNKMDPDYSDTECKFEQNIIEKFRMDSE